MSGSHLVSLVRADRFVGRGVAVACAAALGLGLGPFGLSPPSSNPSSVHPSILRFGALTSIPSGARFVGPVDRARTLAFDVVLAPRHGARLQALAAQVSDRRSPEYRHYLRRGVFARMFGASDATIAEVESSLRASGLHPLGVVANRLAVRVRATAGVIERTWSTRLATYRLTNGTTALLATAGLRLPSSIAAHVQAVIGLDSLADAGPVGLELHLPHQAASTHHLVPGPAPTSACLPDASGVGYTSDQIAAAYGFDGLYQAGDLGAGVSVGLVEFTPVLSSDIAAYASCYGLGYPSVTTVPVDGGPTSSPPANEVEAELDLEDVISLAPKAKVVLYEGADAGGTVSGNSAYDAYATAVNQDAVQVLSSSWGSCEPAVGAGAASAEMTLFEQAALQGQTVVAAAGDNGSEDCYGTLSGSAARQLAVDDPASQPYVTGVGGTTLQIGPRTTETVWNTTLSGPSPGAGGGGVSEFWALPAYQAGAPSSLGLVSPSSACPPGAGLPAGRTPVAGGALRGGRCREVPDVSANAGAPYAIYCSLGVPTDCASGGWTGLGGTSAAAPTWAALFALVDASQACATSGPIGFANPALYAVAATAYAGAFRDVTVGGNDLTGDHPGHYPARRDFDLASGLGTPVASGPPGPGLAAELCGVDARTASAAQLPAPTVARVRPSTIRARPGVHVLINGSNFTGASAVRFGGRAALSFAVRTRTSIVAVAPRGAGLVDVTVTTRGGTSEQVRADEFDYLVRPRLVRTAPAAGASGDTVVLVGSAFEGTVSVMFGSRHATSFTVRSPTRIVAVAPPGHGNVVVTVRTRAGTSRTLPGDRFHYLPSP